MTRSCKNCRYSEYENEAKGTMFCRRYAPKPGTDFEEWPLVWDDDWCGEFEQKIVCEYDFFRESGHEEGQSDN